MAILPTLLHIPSRMQCGFTCITCLQDGLAYHDSSCQKPRWSFMVTHVTCYFTLSPASCTAFVTNSVTNNREPRRRYKPPCLHVLLSALPLAVLCITACCHLNGTEHTSTAVIVASCGLGL
jgi:hypothetical protein